MNAMPERAALTPDPPFSPVIALLTFARTWDADLTAALRELGLTTRTYGLLGHIRATPDTSFSELARRSRITVQSAHVAVGSLVASELVSDAMGQAGSRSRLRLTERGEEVMASAAIALVDLDSRIRSARPHLVQGLRLEFAAMLDGRGADVDVDGGE